jgi:DNA invertase Pin-like site-specific DNA recombinase
MIGKRTREALQAAKARGVKLGSPVLETARPLAVAAIKAEADRQAANILPIIEQIKRSGVTTLRAIAQALNARGIPSPRGGQWHAMGVRNAMRRQG